MYRKRRRYYRKSEPIILDMLIKNTIELFLLIGKLIWRVISNGLRKNNHTEVSNIYTSPKYLAQINKLAEINKSKEIENSNEEERKYDLQASLLTPTEEAFYAVLKEVVGNRYQIIPQVQLSKIMKVRDSDYRYTNYHDFNKINKKSIDFVLYDENLKAHLAIELDDYSHSRPDRIRRDEFVDKIMEEAGLRILHIPVTDHYDLEKLKSEIFQ